MNCWKVISTAQKKLSEKPGIWGNLLSFLTTCAKFYTQRSYKVSIDENDNSFVVSVHRLV